MAPNIASLLTPGLGVEKRGPGEGKLRSNLVPNRGTHMADRMEARGRKRGRKEIEGKEALAD